MHCLASKKVIKRTLHIVEVVSPQRSDLVLSADVPHWET